MEEKMRGKSLDFIDFLTIKEFSKLVNISVSALRYYDNEGIYHPVERGIGTQSNYRFYSPLQITTIKMIRVLSQIGVEMETIKELANNRTPEKLMKLLKENRDKISNRIKFYYETEAVIDTFLSLLYEGMLASESEICVSEMPDRCIRLGDLNDFHGEVSFFREFIHFYRTTPKLNMSYPVGGYFENMNVFLNQPSCPTRFFSLDSKGDDVKIAGLYLIGYTRGYYGETNDLPTRMEEFANKNGLEFSGPVYNIYLNDEISIFDQNSYLLQASAAVTETQHRVNSKRLHRHISRKHE